jgi:hypothetical protein
MRSSLRKMVSLLLASFVTLLLSVLGTGVATATQITASALLSRVAVAAESGSSTYDRALFRHWIDINSDCQDTRVEVLVSESKVTPSYSTSRHCTVTRGQWTSYYDGATWTNPADVDIDHVVALKEAWESGARSWSTANRTAYANDLTFWPSLVAVTDNVNQSKSDRDPAEWLPPRAAARCTYAIQWVQVKYRWRLTINSAERTKLSSLLSGTCGSRSVVLPPRAL